MGLASCYWLFQRITVCSKGQAPVGSRQLGCRGYEVFSLAHAGRQNKNIERGMPAASGCLGVPGWNPRRPSKSNGLWPRPGPLLESVRGGLPLPRSGSSP